jgi:hypothetical protein
MSASASSEREPSNIIPGNVESGYVVLPVSGDQFRDFVKSLLGSPQAITRVLRDPFEIRQADIQSLHDLLIQRVTQQNRGFLAQFKARIGFSDDSGVELNSIENLLSYNEIRPVVTRSITIKWDFLLKFEDKENPERQTVTISFYADFGPSLFDSDSTAISDLFFSLSVRKAGVIQFRVEHTARTWGADIEALLSNQLSAYKKTQPRLRRYANKNSSSIATFVAGWIILSCLIGIALTTMNFSKSQAGKASVLASSSYQSLASIGKGIDYLLDTISSGLWEKYFIGATGFMILSVIVATVVGAWAGSSASAKRPSFILLSRADMDAKAREMGRLDRQWGSFLASSISAIGYGIISSLIFEKLFG